jgi:hypothetical protein
LDLAKGELIKAAWAEAIYGQKLKTSGKGIRRAAFSVDYRTADAASPDYSG